MYNRKFVLTDLGKNITEEINDAVAEIVEYVDLDISKEDIEHFYSVFEKINKRLRDSEENLKKGF